MTLAGSPTRFRCTSSPSGWTNYAAPPVTTSRWRCSEHRTSPTIGAPPKTWALGQLALLLPTCPREESLRLLDEYAALVAQYHQ
ncbi:hypothetical protein I551_4374 [Mycobacterium ulcerans str. Harvey]|uniref:Uncharacterized protein n=1 Tax=Mycobacterium ulcerans str. Harvey TaxID=1299332 RepID=A0ABP3ACS3_MYCUL|nr:hypothetical protein I551_4374 [Mycobacterium ulcerans str. Harvey]